MRAYILAGGQGSRLRCVVSEVAKPVASVKGKPFLLCLMDYWVGQGVTEFVLCTGYLGTSVYSVVGDVHRGVPVRYSHEFSPLGTGGALRKALLGDLPNSLSDVLVLNGDSIFDVSLSEISSFHRSLSKNSSTMAILESDSTCGRYGTFNFNAVSGKLSNIDSLASKFEVFINGGVYILNGEHYVEETNFHYNQPFSLESDYFQRELRMGRLYGLRSRGFFLDIGVPADYQLAQTLTFPS